MPVLRRRFSEMNQVKVGITCLVALALVLTVALRLNAITRMLSGGQYTAQFAQASGLRTGDHVQVSGMKVGTVEGIKLVGTTVQVTFSAEDVHLGRSTRAAIKTANAVGKRFMALEPAGSGTLEAIPVARTSVPYDLNSALSDLTTTSSEIDVDQLASSMDSIATTFRDTPEALAGALRGLSRLSASIGSRDAALSRLLQSADGVSGVLAQRSDQIVQLMSDGNSIFRELTARRAVIHQLLLDTRSLSVRLNRFLADNRAALGPTLASLDRTTDLLRRNDKAIAFMLQHLGAFGRNLGEAVGSGPGFVAFVQNIPPTEFLPVIPGLVHGKAGGLASGAEGR